MNAEKKSSAQQKNFCRDGDKMATTKEIKNRIKSVRDTQKITNAMHLIASTKLRKAKSELDKTRPFFNCLQGEIKRIFRTSEEIENKHLIR